MSAEAATAFLRQRAARENEPKLIYLNVTTPSSRGGGEVGPEQKAFRQPGLDPAGCITNPDLRDPRLHIIHTRTARHQALDARREGRCQQRRSGLGEVLCRAARVPVAGRQGRLSPAPSWCSPQSVPGTAGREEDAKMAPSLARSFAPGPYG